MKTAEEVIRWAGGSFGYPLVLTTSFQKSSLIVLDLCMAMKQKPVVISLDTGRLPEETFMMIEAVRKRYGLSVELVSPDAGELGRMNVLHGPNLFYRDRPSRLLCCQVRKVRPLAARLAGVRAVLTGLRRGDSESRQQLEQIDLTGSPAKISPLAHWSEEEVDTYVKLNDLPMHPLYSRGYTSIGCEPCTRATNEGEGARAGRWWWEDETSKECGIHFSPDGRAQRAVDVLLDEIVTHA